MTNRIAVIDRDSCRVEDCGLLCRRLCPLVRNKIEVIKVDDKGKPIISEELCIGCGICVNKCPFKAISIVNLPGELEGECIHRYGVNGFKLFRLPIPARSTVLGLVGKNGVGKSTSLRILAGKLKPNLGVVEGDPPDWDSIIEYFGGTSLKDYFAKLASGNLRVAYKPQYIDAIPRVFKGEASRLLSKLDERGVMDDIVSILELREVIDRRVDVLSGGELQRVAIAAVVCRDADVYIFDEPSSYLDVRQRIKVARVIRWLAKQDVMVVVAEHDLIVLDYMSDMISVLYGDPGVYGIVSYPRAVRDGINMFLEGYIPSDNVRFRSQPIRFQVKPPTQVAESIDIEYSWGFMVKKLGGFTLRVEPGFIRRGEVIGILGPNGIGKTTFVKLLAGLEKPDEGDALPGGVKVSYKPQYISGDYDGVVEVLLRKTLGDRMESSFFREEIYRPFRLDKILDRRVSDLSGGELQKLAIAICLSMDADIYLLDEPSAYLDVEERLAMARAVRRIVENLGRVAFVVEHDILVQDFIADRLMVFSGIPGVDGYGHQPMDMRSGMNMFLKELGVTFRRDRQTYRPRANKEGSRLDRIQKEMGEYYYTAATIEEE
ncbi:MAG: ribosome biogenesis/translation initiation ATPase RLI [Candidatus Bathyarchaeia archaeon]